MSSLPPETTSVEAQLAEMRPMVLDRFNGSFEDSLVFVARVLGGFEHATHARVTDVDVRGFDLVVVDPDGEHDLRLEYEHEMEDVWQVADLAYGVVRRARIASGEHGRTSAEIEFEAFNAIRTWLTEVRAVEDLNPRLRKITFGGSDLTEFAPLGPDTFLFVLLPPPGRPDLTIGRDFSWERVPEMPEDERPVGAYYTLREWRPADAELDMLFVLHDDAGPASRWATSAQPGDQVALWGPRESYAPPANTDWFLLVADETGLPAVATILESLADDTKAFVFAEVQSLDQRIELPEGDHRTITWIERGDRAPGTAPELLEEAVRALPWPAGHVYAWGGGESRAMTRVRRFLRDEVGLRREQVNLVAYWRHADSPVEPDDDAP
jgi:NADPH-dependent ferric siderophore reductase